MMLRVLVYLLVLLSILLSPQAAPTKRVVTLEAVFDTTEKRFSLNSKQIHGHYSRFMELSGKGNLCPRTITHLSDGNPDMRDIILPHKEINHDGTICHDEGKLLLKYEKKLTSEAIASLFGLQEDVTGFKGSIRRVLLSLDGFYIGVENVTRACGHSSLAKGAAVIITSDSEPFGKEFHIPFHGHPKVMLINDKHKACAFTSAWGAPSSVPVQPAEAQESLYGLVSATASPSPVSPKSQTPTPSITSTKQTVAPSPFEVVPSSTPSLDHNAANTEVSDDVTPSPTQSSSVHDRESPKNQDTTSTSSVSSQDSQSQSQEQGSTPGNQMALESPAAIPTAMTGSGQGHPSASATASVMPTSPKKNMEPKSVGGTTKASAYPSQSTDHRALRTPSSSATLLPSSTEAPDQSHQSATGVLTSQKGSPVQTIQPSVASVAASPVNVLSSAESRKPSIYPDASKAPKIVDMVPKASGFPYKKEKKSSQTEEIVLVGSHSPSAEPSKGGPLIFSGHGPSASLLPSPEVTSTPLVQESPGVLNDPQMTELRMTQFPTASVLKSRTPSPSPAVVEEDDGSACFPASAIAVRENGNLVRVEDLQVGDKVMVGDHQFSPVVDFSHADGNNVFLFDRFITDTGRSLTVTSSHYIYTQRGLLPAREVSPSDFLILSDGTQVNVTGKTYLLARGLFNPHTLLGDIIIDGFKVSTYTSAVEPTIAHALMAPIRLLDMLGSRPTLLSSLVQNLLVMRYFNIRSS